MYIVYISISADCRKSECFLRRFFPLRGRGWGSPNGEGFPLRGGLGFSPTGNGFFSDRRGLLFSPKGEGCTRPDGRGDASQDAGWFIAAPSRRDDSRPLLGPPIVPHPRKRLAASATGGAAPLSPHFLFLVAPKRENGLCTVQKRKTAKAEHTGDSKRGRAGSHRAVLPIYLPATGALYCFAAGDVGVVLRSHEFLGMLLKPRLLLFPRLSSFVSRRISLVSRPSSPVSRGNAQGGTAVPS